MEMGKQFYLEPLKSVPGRSIFHYFCEFKLLQFSQLINTSWEFLKCLIFAFPKMAIKIARHKV